MKRFNIKCSKYNILHFFLYVVIKTVMFILSLLPFSWVKKIVSYYINIYLKTKGKHRRQIAMKNLQRVFPNNTEKENEKIFLASINNWSEVLKFYLGKTKNSWQKISIITKEGESSDILNIMQKITDRTLIYTLHIKGFESIPVVLGQDLHLASKIHSVYKDHPSFWIDKLLQDGRYTSCLAKSDKRKVVNTFKSGKSVSILNDQRDTRSDVMVDFLNHNIGASSPSSCRLAIENKYNFVIILPDGDHMRIEHIAYEDVLKMGSNTEEIVQSMMQLIFSKFNELIVANPQNWLMWIHNMQKR